MNMQLLSLVCHTHTLCWRPRMQHALHTVWVPARLPAYPPAADLLAWSRKVQCGAVRLPAFLVDPRVLPIIKPT